uniref:Uncharacterized protein n=1 Tax=Lepeophtheirus salmonis TaxID=72036 RepID=A0A0K2T921_LEPSM
MKGQNQTNKNMKGLQKISNVLCGYIFYYD